MAGIERQKNDLGYRIALGGIKGITRILVLVALVVILVFIGRKSYELGYTVFHEKPVDKGEGRAVTVTVTDDMSVRQIGRLLNANGLLKESPTAFMIQELISEYHGQILPGTYTLRTSMTADEMFPILAQADKEGQRDNGAVNGAVASSSSASQPTESTSASQTPAEGENAAETQP
jgi:UPF0755 protein